MALFKTAIIKFPDGERMPLVFRTDHHKPCLLPLLLSLFNGVIIDYLCLAYMHVTSILIQPE